MKPGQIFVGNIKMCTKYEEKLHLRDSTYINGQCIDTFSMGTIKTEDELYKENAILIKLDNGGYVDLDTINFITDYLKIYRDTLKDGYRLGGLIMATSATREGRLFVDEKSLRPYFGEHEQNPNVSIYQLKKIRNNERGIHL